MNTKKQMEAITKTEFSFTISLIFTFLCALLLVIDGDNENFSLLLKPLMFIVAMAAATIYFLVGWYQRRKQNQVANRNSGEFLTK